MDLPIELKSPRKGLINIKNKDKNCFLLCHVRHINLWNKHLERILKTDKKIAEELNYDRIEFPVMENKTKLKQKIIYALIYLVMKKKKVFPIIYFRSKIWRFNRFITFNW